MKPADELIALTRALVGEIRGTDVTKAEWTAGEFSVKIERHVPGAAARSEPAERPAASFENSNAPNVVKAPDNDHFKVRSPMHGIFYSAPDQTAPPFVKVGDMVVEGQVLCILEAMKVFTKLTAERSGTLVSVGPSSGQEIAPGDVLFDIATNVER